MPLPHPVAWISMFPEGNGTISNPGNFSHRSLPSIAELIGTPAFWQYPTALARIAAASAGDGGCFDFVLAFCVSDIFLFPFLWQACVPPAVTRSPGAITPGPEVPVGALPVSPEYLCAPGR